MSDTYPELILPSKKELLSEFLPIKIHTTQRDKKKNFMVILEKNKQLLERFCDFIDNRDVIKVEDIGQIIDLMKELDDVVLSISLLHVSMIPNVRAQYDHKTDVWKAIMERVFHLKQTIISFESEPLKILTQQMHDKYGRILYEDINHTIGLGLSEEDKQKVIDLRTEQGSTALKSNINAMIELIANVVVTMERNTDELFDR